MALDLCGHGRDLECAECMHAQASFVAQAEPGVEDDADLYSDEEADYMETDVPQPLASGIDASAAVPPAKADGAGAKKGAKGAKRSKTGGRR